MLARSWPVFALRLAEIGRLKNRVPDPIAFCEAAHPPEAGENCSSTSALIRSLHARRGVCTRVVEEAVAGRGGSFGVLARELRLHQDRAEPVSRSSRRCCVAGLSRSESRGE